MVHLERHERHRRRHQQVIVLVELLEFEGEVRALGKGLEQLQRAPVLRMLGVGHQPRVEQLAPLLIAAVPDLQRGREPQLAKDIDGGTEARVDLGHLGAKLFQLLRGFLHALGDLRIDIRIAEVRRVGDTQSAQIAFQIHAPVLRLTARGIGIAIIVAADHVEHARGVARMPGQRTDMRQRRHLGRRPLRGPAEGGLEAEHAGEGGRDTNRTARVAALMEHAHVQRRRRSSAAGRAARRQARIPGIAGRAVHAIVGHGLPAEFRGVGLAQKDRARLAQHARRRCVGLALGRAGGQRAVACRHAGRFGEVLQRSRHAIDRR